ncbi:MAG: lytic transglycosylase domain-containing protein [Saprospiraceae bacterium]
MKNFKVTLPVIIGIAIVLFGAILISFSPKGKADAAHFFNLQQRVSSVNLNKAFYFADEEVPINEDTYERLDRELSVNAYWQSSTLLQLKLAHKYFPEVERILKNQGIPDDFKYLAVAESGLRNPTSSSGAKGYWQFMKPTAKELNLEISADVDERLHLEKSTMAACTYIKQLYNRFGNWTNAAGAYNIGPTAFAKAVDEQKESSYYMLNVNDETSRYVFRIVAFKEILSNPNNFGYYIENFEKYMPHTQMKEIEVTSTIESLADFAHANGTSYRLLKYYNPWLINSRLTVPVGKTYRIKIPA